MIATPRASSSRQRLGGRALAQVIPVGVSSTRSLARSLPLLVLLALAFWSGISLGVTAAQAGDSEPPLLGSEQSYRGSIPGRVVEAPPWIELDTDQLAPLVDEALRNNGDLQAALARIEQADALAMQALAPALPFVSATVGANLTPGDLLGAFQAPGYEPPAVAYTGTALLLARWNVDLFGQSIQAHRAGRQDGRASRDDRDAFALSLGVQVVEAWLDVGAARGQLQILERQLEIAEGLVVATELRYEAGSASASAVLAQRQQLAAIGASIPAAQITIEVARQRLSTLMGRPPGAPLAKGATILPALPPPPPTARPVDLLEARPDLRAAQHRDEASLARRRSAVRGFLPSLSINGSAGWAWMVRDEFEDTGTWGLGATVNIPVFSGGANIAAVRAARAGRRASAGSLRQQVLRAVAEVENALVSRSRLSQQVQGQADQLRIASDAFEVERRHYLGGTGDSLRVLAAFDSLQRAELGDLLARRSLLGAHLRLRLALGGEWTHHLHNSQD